MRHLSRIQYFRLYKTRKYQKWQAELIRQFPFCEMPGCPSPLNDQLRLVVHHLDYATKRGKYGWVYTRYPWEFEHGEEAIVCCDSCHDLAHGFRVPHHEGQGQLTFAFMLDNLISVDFARKHEEAA